MAYLSYLLTRGFVELFRFVPFRVLYVLSDGVAFLLHRVIRYRRKVVFDNLRRCFPDKTPQELEAIARTSYRNLADITLESVKGTTTSLDELKRRYTYKNYEVVNRLLDAGKSVVAVGGHYNNWEWGVVTIAGGFHGHTIGIYKPLSNPHTNRWFFNNRARDGHMILKSMKETFAAMQEYEGKPSVLLLVADQSPSNRKTAIDVEFFGHKTACLPGGEVIARKFDYPVVLFEIQRLRRGYYELTFSEICLESAASQPGEITQLFMSRMEDTLRRNPGPWLWSHRRWKW